MSHQSSVNKLERQVFLNISKNFEVVFDVGARTDLVYYELRNDLEYHIFEPNPKFYSYLTERVNGIHTHRIKLNKIGLGDKDTDGLVYYTNSQSTIPNPVLSANNSYDPTADFKIDVVTLKTYVNRNNVNRIDFLKTDTEGLDYDILKSGLDVITELKIPFIQFEYWTNGVRDFKSLLSDYKLYLLNEPVLARFTGEKEPILEIDGRVISLIDNWIRNGWGGNVLAVRNDENITPAELRFNYPTYK